MRAMNHGDFGARVRCLRERKRWTITELAEACGVDRAAASRWDSGETRPRDEDRLFAALGTTAARFYAMRLPSRSRAA